MTHEEIDNAIAVMQAFKEGKTIEVKYRDQDDRWTIASEPNWDFSLYKYRIKSEPKYRPFKSAEEVMEAIKEHGIILKPNMCSGARIAYHIITSIYPPTDDNPYLRVRFNGSTHKVSEMDWCYFADGAPLGILEEE